MLRGSAGSVPLSLGERGTPWVPSKRIGDDQQQFDKVRSTPENIKSVDTSGLGVLWDECT